MLTEENLHMIDQNQYDLEQKLNYKWNPESDEDRKIIQRSFNSFNNLHFDYTTSCRSENIACRLKNKSFSLKSNILFIKQCYNNNYYELKKYKMKYNVRGSFFAVLSCAIGCSLAYFTGGYFSLVKPCLEK